MTIRRSAVTLLTVLAFLYVGVDPGAAQTKQLVPGTDTRVSTVEGRQADQKQADKKQADKKQADKKQADKKQADKKQADKKQADKKQADKKQADKKQADKKQADKKPADKKQTDKKQTDKKQTDKKQTDKKQADKKQADKKQADKKQADKKQADKKQADKKQADKPKSDTPETDNGEDGREEPEESKGNYFHIWVLLAGFAGLGIFTWYTYCIQKRFYDLASERMNTGGSLTTTSVPMMATALEAVAGGTPVLSGPSSVVVGSAAEFQVVVNGNPPQAVAWSVLPADMAAISPGAPGTSKLIAAKAGAFTLTAKVGDTTAEISVAALEPSRKEFKIPFVGQGFGSFFAAILLITIAATLGIMKVLSPESVATLLGAIAGYIFGLNQAPSKPDAD